MSDSSPVKHAGEIDATRLAAIDHLLIIALKEGHKAKRRAINKVLEVVPQWTRGDCWRRLRQLRRRPEIAALNPDQAESHGTSTKRKQRRAPMRPWTESDDDHLLNWAGYETVKKIAQRLDRSESAVRFRMGALGMSAKVLDGFSQRSLRKLLRISPTRLRSLIGSNRLRVRDPRVTAASLARYLETSATARNPEAKTRFEAAQQKGDVGYSWERVAVILGASVECIQTLICSGEFKVVDPFVTERQFEEFCRKHGHELNLELLDATTAKWLVNEYHLPRPAVEKRGLSRSQKHALMIRRCACGREIAGNAYFRHRKTCSFVVPARRDRPSIGGVRHPKPGPPHEGRVRNRAAGNATMAPDATAPASLLIHSRMRTMANS